MTLPNRAAVTGALLAILLAVSGCSGGTSATPTETATASVFRTPAVSAAGFNDADVAFAQMMIIHHRDALTMAEMAADHTTDPAVLDLATGISAAQTAEIALMTSWLKTWGAEVPAGPTTGMMGQGSTVPGLMSAEQMTMLGDARDAAFDTAFLSGMIDHHSGAITMAQDEQAHGTNPDAVALAKQIEQAQTKEIDKMRTMLAS